MSTFHAWVIAAGNDPSVSPVTIGGATGGVVAIIAVLVRELNRASGGAWKVVRTKNAEIHRLRWESAHWQFRAGVSEDPGPYKPPTDQELKTW